MADIIIEVYNHHGIFMGFHRCNGEKINIGRSYDNTITLHDEFIDGQHAQITYSDSELTLFDLNSTNGLTVNNKPVTESIPIEPGDDIIIGRMTLKVLLANQAVQKTKSLLSGNAFIGLMMQKWLAFVLLLIIFFGTASFFELFSVEKFNATSYIARGLLAVLAVLIIAAIWALIGRVITHKTYFLTQLSLVCSLAIGLIISGFSADIVEFNSNSSLLFMFTSIPLMGSIALYIIQCQLKVATSLSSTYCWQIALLMVTLVIVAVAITPSITEKDFNPDPEPSNTLFPPQFKWAPAQSISSYLDNLQKTE